MLVHFQPLPTRSSTPHALAPAGWLPAGSGSQLEKSNTPCSGDGSASPHGCVRSPDGLPKAARWNSASVGRRAPRHRAYAAASAWLTYTGQAGGSGTQIEQPAPEPAILMALPEAADARSASASSQRQSAGPPPARIGVAARLDELEVLLVGDIVPVDLRTRRRPPGATAVRCPTRTRRRHDRRRASTRPAGTSIHACAGAAPPVRGS